MHDLTQTVSRFRTHLHLSVTAAHGVSERNMKSILTRVLSYQNIPRGRCPESGSTRAA